MTSYLYEVRSADSITVFTNKAAAAKAARNEAKLGRVADVWKMLAVGGKAVTNLGRIYTSTPRA